jgi:hypothetical protein
MKTLPLSFDQYRRQIRRHLFLKRQHDKDHSEARLFSEAQKLDAQLIAAGYGLIYPTEWAQTFNQKRHLERSKKRSPSMIAVWQTDLNSSDMSE